MENCDSRHSIFKTSIGTLKFMYCGKGVHSIKILPYPILENFTKENEQNVQNLKGTDKEDILNQLKAWLNAYFSSSVENLENLPPVCSEFLSEKGDFTVRVWKTLMKEVTFGQTISYGELAALSGNKAASRAVGSAMKNNCIPLIIPCHRVIRSDGKIGQFSAGGGNTVKEWLLKHEKASFKT